MNRLSFALCRPMSSSRRHSAPAVCCVLALVLIFGLAVPRPVAAEESAWNMVFDVTEVNIVNVEVVVTDSEGNLVTGLTRDDFEMSENGQPVELSNFYAMEGGVTVSEYSGAPEEAASAAADPAEPIAKIAAVARPVHLVIYVDTANIAKINRAKILKRVREFLLEHWRDGMRVMLVSNEGPASGSAVIRQGFTSVPHDLFVALDELSEQALAGPRLDQDQRTLRRDIANIKNNTARGNSTFDENELPYEDAVYAEAQTILQRIVVYNEQALVNIRQTIGILSRFIDAMAGMPGRKSILYVSDGLDVTPGADLLESMRGYQSVTHLNESSFVSAIDTDRRNATRDVEELIVRANGHRVTLNILDASPPSLSVGGAAEVDGVDGTITGNWNTSLSSVGQRNRVEALVSMAIETGGQAGLGLSAVAATLDGVISDLDNHYSLGYVAKPREDDKSRTIKVAVKGRKDLEVRHRSSVRDKSVIEEAAERAQAALLIDDLAGSEIDDNPLDVALLERDAEPQDDGNFLVPVLVTIPLGKLVLLPGEELHQAQVSMFVAVRDDMGRTSGVNQHLCPIRIPNDEVLTALGQRATCGIRLMMRGGPQRVAVSVLDATAAVHSTVRLDLDVGAAAVAEQAALR